VVLGQSTVRVSADPAAEAARTIDYHAEVFMQPEPIWVGANVWYQLVDGGYVRGRDIRRLEPVDALAGEEVADDEIWVDVDLDQQVLTVMRGTAPIYATLISSGLKGPTPRGLFRISKKLAYGSMTSSPGASEAYAVEAVPHVQFIHEGIALHSAYWHDRFGFRISHGCINLAPRDAQHVYSLTGPHARDGWMDVYEDEGDMGTRVRIHDGVELVADRRGPVEHVQG
jgi:lipoprotein-anchoring transpeptidase ErfK/SrfK